ncbi:MAG TPA: hypothetical protein VJ912_01745 [Candidatus Nanoarchaeia archaeon]|nr:hypothetical protein [Candidatus Nanoarchaeia archaeon]
MENRKELANKCIGDTEKNNEKIINEIEKRDNVLSKLYNDPEISEKDIIKAIDNYFLSYVREVSQKNSSLKPLSMRYDLYWSRRKDWLGGNFDYNFPSLEK